MNGDRTELLFRYPSEKDRAAITFLERAKLLKARGLYPVASKLQNKTEAHDPGATTLYELFKVQDIFYTDSIRSSRRLALHPGDRVVTSIKHCDSASLQSALPFVVPHSRMRNSVCVRKLADCHIKTPSDDGHSQGLKN